MPEMHDFPPYPVFLNLVQSPVLIVGGGSVGLRKAAGLAACAARVTVVSPEFAAGFEKLDVERIHASYAATHMARKPWRLVFAATDSPAVNSQVQRHAKVHGVLCSRADDPEAADFSSGAIQRLGATRKSDGRGAKGAGSAGGLVIAVSTAGASPVLAARICREAASKIDPILPLLADLLSEWRIIVKQTLSDMEARRRLLHRLAGEEMEGLLRKHGRAKARRFFAQWLEAAKRPQAGDSLAAPASADKLSVKHAC
jgi:precorrin-2 dehydrogenase/sirohydrochlorin ferrochelatase